MAAGARRPSRRSLLKYALGSLGSLAAPAADVALLRPKPAAAYQVIDRRALSSGGSGLFIAVTPGLTRAGLRALGEHLREEFQAQPNVVVEIFDDPDAARTVRAGSRMVGEERFAAARARQRASYRKNAQSAQHVFIMYDEPPETVRY